MSKPLNRPLFRMGGSPNTNSGIVSGFQQPRKNFLNGTSPSGGNTRTPFNMSTNKPYLYSPVQGSSDPDYVAPEKEVNVSSIDGLINTNTDDYTKQAEKLAALQDKLKPGEKPSGLSSSDWLRVAAAGAEILGAEGRGDGIGAALAAASPALSGLGGDLATSRDVRDTAYDAKETAYNQVLLSGAQADLDNSREFGQSKALLRLQSQLDPDKFANQYDSRRSREIRKEMSNMDNTSDEYSALKNELLYTIYGDLSEANLEAKADLLGDKDFLEKISSQADKLITQSNIIAEENKKSGTANTKENNPYYGVQQNVLEDALKKKAFQDVMIDIAFPQGITPDKKANGGRIGYANGSGPYEPGSGPNPDPGSPPVMSFEELRARLPQEVSDSVIQLITQSEQAMIDFAQIQTPQDIQVFNQKYNTDLQTPNQVG